MLERELDGWHLPPGVAALVALVAHFPDSFGPLVLTTNLDPLIELAIRRAGGRTHTLRLHGDGSLETLLTDDCGVAHLHGYWRGADTLHALVKHLP